MGRLQRFEFLDYFLGSLHCEPPLMIMCLLVRYCRFGGYKSPCKACPPSTRVTCLGVLFDTINFTTYVTPHRLLEQQTELLLKWLTKKSVPKTELQSLIGKLAFVSKCVRPGRLFLTHILDTLHSLRCNHHRVTLSAEFQKDIHW